MQRLAFVLAGILLLGCPGDDTTDETGASASGTGTSGGASSGADSSGSMSAPSTDGGTSPTSDSGSGTVGSEDLFEACQATCMLLVECRIEDIPNCGIPCAGIANTVAGCEAPYVAQQQCVAALSCDDAQAWVDATGDYPCAAEDAAYDECMG